jgi:serine protease Do
MGRCGALFGSVIFAVSLTSAQPVAPVSLKSISSAVQAVAERADVAVVQITARGLDSTSADSVVQSRSGRGSGVLVDAVGHVITNAHVVGTARRVEVLVPKQGEGRLVAKLMPAEVIGSDKETDIAVLKVNLAGGPYLRFADSDALRQGELVLALGSPFGLTNSVSMGVVSSVARELRAEEPTVYIQTDAAIHPGNSGGPLVNAEGEVVGINTFLLSGSGGTSGVGFAVPSNTVRNVYEQILKHGRVKRGQIGILPESITPRLAKALGLPRDSGVILSDVTSGSAAEAAGLAIRDIVTAINGKPVENARQLGTQIYQHAGDVVKLDVVRDGKPIEVRVTVMERPRDPDRILSLVAGPGNLVSKLGVLAVDLDERASPLLPQLRRLSGAVIAGVVADMSGHEESLRAGDVVYAVNNTAVRSLTDLKAAVSGLVHGETVVLHIERQGQLQFLTLEIE